MHFLSNYGLFLAKTLTVVVAIIAVLATILALKAKAKAESEEGVIEIKKLNEKFDKLALTINDTIKTKEEKKAEKLAAKKEAKNKKKSKDTESSFKKRLFVLIFNGDIKASAVEELRETITSVLLSATKKDHVLVRLDSAGGIVNAYGLAASQLQRLRDAKIPLTISIDKIAASGGYMMACVANEIIAAPFAIIGSIGVVAQLPNFHRWLQKNDIDFEQITAGEYKRTLTVFGKNTDKDRFKMQEDVNDTHDLFKTFVKANRPYVEIDEVATGEHWFGAQCIEKKLVDKLQTSDDYLLSHKDTYDIYEINYKVKHSLTKRFNLFAQKALSTLVRA